MNTPYRIVIVGGGAGGLELATKLGDRLGRRGLAQITLVDMAWTHIWKPLLHEVAAGTMDSAEDELEYLAQARWHHFRFRLGKVVGVDRERREVHVASSYDEEGTRMTPERRFGYDTLVLAVGSLSNDFGIPGVKEHCLFLDTTAQAERFQQRLLSNMLRAHAQGTPIAEGQLDVAIVGAGATGVELAAQLHRVTRQLSAYGLDEVDPERHIHLHIVEAADRILAALPPKISDAAATELARLGVRIHTGERVVRVTKDGIHTASGSFIPAALKVWAAGIKAPDVLAELGLETNAINQLVVHRTLQTTRDEAIFALGDCAACPLDASGATVPPRAQAAHQQASLLAKSLERRVKGSSPLPVYSYRDYGSLITLGEYSTVGNLMGNLTGSLTISGFFARTIYLSLYKMHQAALFGWPRAILITLLHFMRRGIDPQVKLH